MANTKFYLDIRNKKKDNTCPLKLSISKNGKTSLLSLNVFITKEQWNKPLSKIINHPRKQFLNTYIAQKKLDADTFILQLLNNRSFAKMTVVELKNHIKANIFYNDVEEDKHNENLFVNRFEKFKNSKSEGSKKIYKHTLDIIKKFVLNYENLTFEDVNKYWLLEFNEFLKKTSPSQNARNIHFRNIRAVFNDAIDDEITSFYPFRKFKIKTVKTVKRSLTLADLRTLFNYPVEEHMIQYLDMFKLIFYLVGINIVDLCNLKKIEKGRIEYYRAKTKKLYSIKVEPEAMQIIEKYRGENYLLNILDRYSHYKDYANRLNRNLQKIGKVERVGRGGKKVYNPLFPKISTYWARHTWATIASELDIPKETIAAALGHAIGNSVTSIYIDFNMSKVDAANRAVIKYVLGKD